MNYNTIIVEMLSRIQALEDKVKKLEESQDNSTSKESSKVRTCDIRDYILELKRAAAEKGNTELILVAKDVHGALGLKQRYPMVCNAMRQVMQEGDFILYSPESGYSSTLEIKYYLQKGCKE